MVTKKIPEEKTKTLWPHQFKLKITVCFSSEHEPSVGRTRNARGAEGFGYTAVLTGSWGYQMLLITNVVQM